MVLAIIILIVALGLSIFLNIELWHIAKELKMELHENDGRCQFDVNTTE